MIDDPRDDRYPGDGWGGEDEGVRRVDDCIDEAHFGGDDGESGRDAGGRAMNLAALRVRLARALLPTAGGSEAIAPTAIGVGWVPDDTAGGGDGRRCVVRLRIKGGDIDAAIEPDMARSVGDDLLDGADDVQGVPGETIAVGEGGGR